MAVVRIDGEPLGTAAFWLDPPGELSRDQLADGLFQQLGAELREAFALPPLEPPRSLPSVGTPANTDRGDGAPSPGPSVSVVVTTCRDPAALERCLRSILASEYERFEVIVVENRPGSSATRRMLGERFANDPRLRYVEEPCPGLSRARNAGLAWPRARWSRSPTTT